MKKKQTYFSSSARPHEGDQRHRYYRAVIRTLPRVNYVLLKRLIGLLVKVAERKEKSKMGTVV